MRGLSFDRRDLGSTGPRGASVPAYARPAAVEALPDEKTARGRMEQTYLRKLDFAVDGSPTRQQLMSPRSLVLSRGADLCTPPKSISSMPRLTSPWP